MNFTKKLNPNGLIYKILNRKYIFDNAALHHGDHVNMLRCLDITLIDYLNSQHNLQLNRTNGFKLLLQAAQVLLIFLCIGVPKLIGMKWHQKYYLIAFAIIQWYSIMCVRYIMYERSENHILQNKPQIKIVSKFNRKHMTFRPEITVNKQTIIVTMDLVQDSIFNKQGFFDRKKFCEKCQVVDELFKKRAQ